MVLASVIQTVYPDVWYDTNLNAIIGTASWVIAGLATGTGIRRLATAAIGRGTSG